MDVVVVIVVDSSCLYNYFIELVVQFQLQFWWVFRFGLNASLFSISLSPYFFQNRNSLDEKQTECRSRAMAGM